MGQAAQRYGLTIQYCMPYPRHLLQSLEVPAVTQTRASDDYTAGNSQWMIGDTSILDNALGLAPFKDNFFTNSTQPRGGCHTIFQEPYPLLQAVVATYSTGPVGPSDHIAAVDKTIVMQTCAIDGRILKPSKPMRNIDSSFLQRAFGSGGPSGEVWSTHTEVSGLRWYHVLSVDLTSTYQFLPKDMLDSHQSEYSVSWVAYTHTLLSDPVPFDESRPIELPKCGRSDFGLWHIAPVFENGWVLLGEMDKFVPVSEQRIRAIEATATDVMIQLVGVPGEEVSMSFWNPSNRSTPGMKFTCTIKADGSITLVIPQGNCM